MKKHLFTSSLIILLSALYIYSCSQPATSIDYPPGSVKGIVYDSATHLPLEHVTVTISTNNDGAITDSNGFFLISDITMPTSAVNTIITASKTGYITISFRLIVYSNDTANISFPLVPSGLAQSKEDLNFNPKNSSASLKVINKFAPFYGQNRVANGKNLSGNKKDFEDFYPVIKKFGYHVIFHSFI